MTAQGQLFQLSSLLPTAPTAPYACPLGHTQGWGRGYRVGAGAGTSVHLESPSDLPRRSHVPACPPQGSFNLGYGMWTEVWGVQRQACTLTQLSIGREVRSLLAQGPGHSPAGAGNTVRATEVGEGRAGAAGPEAYTSLEVRFTYT